jgi:RHS repeat-associated protein
MSYRPPPRNSDGSTPVRYRYDLALPATEPDAFGALVVDVTAHDPAAPEGRFAFGGRAADPARALEYNRARYHDPLPGRWLAEDPRECAAPPQP